MLSLYQKTEGAKQMEKRVTVGCPVGGARHNAENSLDRLTADTLLLRSLGAYKSMCMRMCAPLGPHPGSLANASSVLTFVHTRLAKPHVTSGNIYHRGRSKKKKNTGD